MATCIQRLYAELDGSMLLELVSMDEHASNSVNVDEVLEVLVANNRHHALALLQWGKAGSPRKALEIWRGLTTKKLFDDAYVEITVWRIAWCSQQVLKGGCHSAPSGEIAAYCLLLLLTLTCVQRQ